VKINLDLIRAASARCRELYGEDYTWKIKEYRRANPGAGLGDAILAIAGEQTYAELKAENERLRAALRHAVHKVEQTLAGQYPDGAALDSVLIVARAALARPEGGAR
jgi:hypothetical protein